MHDNAPANSASNPRRLSAQICALLALISVAVYWPVRGFDFINFDDPLYVSENPYVLNGFTWDSLVWAFQAHEGGNWHPLIWLTHMFVSEFWGANAGAHHLANVAFHAVNSALVFLVLQRMTGAVIRSALAGAFFALHPMHVESVAWISERKDVLSTLFWLLTMLAYTHYAECKRQKAKGAMTYYALTLVCFALGLMSKPMLVTLPFVLLLMDFWPLGRFATAGGPPPANISSSAESTATIGQVFWRLLLEKWPFFLLTFLTSAMTFVIQKDIGAVNPVALDIRLANASNAYAQYILKFFYPHAMGIFYPLAEIKITQICWNAALLVLISTAFLRAAKTRPYLLIGWLWFLGTLVPVIGLVQAGSQSMADRYTYVPYIGLFIAFFWWLRESLPRLRFLAIGLVLLAGATAVTVNQLHHWRDTLSLYSHTNRVIRPNINVLNILGNEFIKLGRPLEALDCFQTALRIKPDDVMSQNNIGTALIALGRHAEAERQHREALAREPKSTQTLACLGIALIHQTRFEEAAEYLQKAAQLEPQNPGARYNFGHVLALQKKWPEAVTELQEAIRLRPNYPQAHADLGYVFASTDEVDKAIASCQQALRLNPTDANSRVILEKLLRKKQSQENPPAR